MLSTSELFDLKGIAWSDEPPTACSPFDAMLWRTASELASLLEMTLEADAFIDVAPGSIDALESVTTYLENKGVLRPHSVLLVLLRLRRHEAGLGGE